MARKISKPLAYERKCKGVKFRVRETGQNWTIDAQERGAKTFKRVQSVSDLNLAKRIINNQRECRR